MLVTLGQAATCPLSLHSLSLSRSACQGKMENAGLGKALFRKPHFLKHLQGFTKFANAWNCRETSRTRIAYRKSGNTRTDALASGRCAENRPHPNQASRLASKTAWRGIALSRQKSTCLFLAYLIHSTYPVWVALRSVPHGMSATLPLS